MFIPRCEIFWNRFSVHSIHQVPGLPLRTFNSSTFQRGNPTPGIPSSNSLGNALIFQRVTQAVVLRLSGFVRIIKPVTPLCSTANWSRLEAELGFIDHCHFSNFFKL